MQTTRAAQAIELMMRFADRTGLTSGFPPRRYLWTDAFAVCNFLGLERATGKAEYCELALRLVDQVHHTLGRHREDDPHQRQGWISGLSEEEGEAHPTRGGLRIGKPLPERKPSDPADPQLEWDRDGQYFHYLTRWMHALDQVSRATGEARFNLWACELAQTAQRAFSYGPPSRARMAWKMSVDLSWPLVASMGQHDPLDGFVTFTRLAATASDLGRAPEVGLLAATAELAHLVDRQRLATSDPLGLGGLLIFATQLAQLGASPALASNLLEAAEVGLRRYTQQTQLRTPAHNRLGFRELGLAIGLAGLGMLKLGPSSPDGAVAYLVRQLALREEIEAFWLRPYHRATPSWLEHADINDVMLATSLAPEGFLNLERPAAGAPAIEPAAPLP